MVNSYDPRYVIWFPKRDLRINSFTSLHFTCLQGVNWPATSAFSSNALEPIGGGQLGAGHLMVE